MASTTSPKILLTGATGYIGGSILTHLLNSTSPCLSSATITCLVRGQERVTTLSSKYGDRVNPVLYKDLDDLETTTAVAAEHDLVINTTFGYHPTSPQALVRGLAIRKQSTGRDVWLIHTSGTSNLADYPVTKKWVEKYPEREFDDAKDDIYGYEKEREALDPYLQRTSELGVIDAGLELGVKTLIIMSPLIFGQGTGLFNNISIQIPAYIRAVLDYGRSVVVKPGEGVWDHVHVEDLAELYKIAAVEVLDNGGKGLPSGKEGIIFSANGRHTWMEVARRIGEACFEEGKIKEKEVESLDLTEAARMLKLLGEVDEELLEVALSSNSRTVSTVGSKLGWKPTRGEEAWKKGFRDDVQAMLKKK